MSNPTFLNDGAQSTNASPTITTLDISTHLDLLASFDRLLESQKCLDRGLKIDERVLQVPDGSPAGSGAGSKMGSRAGLECFFHFAVFRFELWLGRIADYLPSAPAPTQEDQSESQAQPPARLEIELTLEYLPPLDVLMVWYSYCLHSRQYYEDSLRLYPILHHLKFPTRLAAAEYVAFSRSRDITRPTGGETWPRLGTCLPANYHTRAGAHAVGLWRRLTNTPFDPLEFALSPTLRTFVCPGCDGTLEAPFHIKKADSIVDLEHTWSDNTDECRLVCQSCAWSGLKRDLGLLRFLRDLHSGLETGWCDRAHDDDDHDHQHQNENEVMNCLAGSLTTDVQLKDFRAASAFSQRVLDQTRPCGGSLPHLLDIPGALGLLGRVGELVYIGAASDEPDLQETKRAWDRLLVAYSVPEPFSVDLIHAVRKESWFARKMVRLGWTMTEDSTKEHSTGQERAADRQQGLERSIARYRAFSELASATPSAYVLIPTLDIDLAWKTDRLRGIEFVESMTKHNKQMINHPSELGMERSRWLVHFKLTAIIWIERYHISYSRYGAPFANAKGRRAWLKKALRDILPRPVVRFSIEHGPELQYAKAKEFFLSMETGADMTGTGKELAGKASVPKENDVLVGSDASGRELNELQDKKHARSRVPSNVSERGQQEQKDKQTCRLRVGSITSVLGLPGRLPKTSNAPCPDPAQAQPVAPAQQLTALVGQQGNTGADPGADKARQAVQAEKLHVRTDVRMQPSKDSLRVRFEDVVKTDENESASGPPRTRVRMLEKARKSSDGAMAKTQQETSEERPQPRGPSEEPASADRPMQADANELKTLSGNSRTTAEVKPSELHHIPQKENPTAPVKRDPGTDNQFAQKATQAEENSGSKDPAPMEVVQEDKKKVLTRSQTRPRTKILPPSPVESAGSVNLEFEIPVGKIAFVEEGNKLRCL